MVNYGYGPDSKNWNEHKKFELASKLENLLGTMMKEGKMKSMNHVCMPYVEVDELYIGVRIRKITHLSNEVVEELVHRSDSIYTDVMTSSEAKGGLKIT